MVEPTPETQLKPQDLQRDKAVAKKKLKMKEKISASTSTETENLIEVKVTQNSDTLKSSRKLKPLLLNSQVKRSS